MKGNVYYTRDCHFRVTQWPFGYVVQELVETGEWWHVCTVGTLAEARRLVGGRLEKIIFFPSKNA